MALSAHGTAIVLTIVADKLRPDLERRGVIHHNKYFIYDSLLTALMLIKKIEILIRVDS